MSSRTRMALGLTGGYALGRLRKGRWLVAALAMVGTRQLGSAVVRRSAAALDSSPELRGLATQSREVAVGLLSHQIEGLTERVHARTVSLRPSSHKGPAPGGDGDTGDKRDTGDTGGSGDAGGSGDGDSRGGRTDTAERHERGGDAPERPDQRKTFAGSGAGRSGSLGVTGRPRARVGAGGRR